MEEGVENAGVRSDPPALMSCEDPTPCEMSPLLDPKGHALCVSYSRRFLAFLQRPPCSQVAAGARSCFRRVWPDRCVERHTQRARWPESVSVAGPFQPCRKRIHDSIDTRFTDTIILAYATIVECTYRRTSRRLLRRGASGGIAVRHALHPDRGAAAPGRRVDHAPVSGAGLRHPQRQRIALRTGRTPGAFDAGGVENGRSSGQAGVAEPPDAIQRSAERLAFAHKARTSLRSDRRTNHPGGTRRKIQGHPAGRSGGGAAGNHDLAPRVRAKKLSGGGDTVKENSQPQAQGAVA